MANKSENASLNDSPSIPECSICLEPVVDNNTQAIAKLKCGHIFHMSCIGCEFNVRGLMQCPNCRVIENSDWLFCIGAPELEIITEDPDEEMDNADGNQNQTQNLNQTQNDNQHQNISLCPHGVRNCPGPQHDDHGLLPVIRPPRALQNGGNGSNAVFPDARVHQHSYIVPTLPPPVPQSTPFNASNAAAVAALGRANGILNYRPPVILGPNGPVPFVGNFGLPESTLFPPNLARNRILYGANPPSASIQALLARRGQYWAPRPELNLVGLEPSLFNRGRASTTSADALDLNLTSGAVMEHLFPFTIYYGLQGSRPFEGMINPEDPNADGADPGMINFL